MGVRRPDARHSLHMTSVVVQESGGFSRGGGTLPHKSERRAILGKQ